METNGATDRLTEALEEKLSHPVTSPDFDLHKGVDQVLADIGMAGDDSAENSHPTEAIRPDRTVAHTGSVPVLAPRGSSKPEWLPLRK